MSFNCGIQWAFHTLTLLFSLVDSKDDMEVDETDIVAVQDGKSSIIMLTRSCYLYPSQNPLLHVYSKTGINGDIYYDF